MIYQIRYTNVVRLQLNIVMITIIFSWFCLAIKYMYVMTSLVLELDLYQFVDDWSTLRFSDLMLFLYSAQQAHMQKLYVIAWKKVCRKYIYILCSLCFVDLHLTGYLFGRKICDGGKAYSRILHRHKNLLRNCWKLRDCIADFISKVANIKSKW